MNTHKFKLPSGIECVITELTGKQQRILTEQTKKKHNDKLAEMLASIIVSIGSDTNITEEFIKKDMLVCDRKMALVEARQFSFDFDTDFEFQYQYKDEDGQKSTISISEEIPDGHFPLTTVKKLAKDKKGETILVEGNYKEYEEIEKQVTITLPKSKLEVRFTMLDGTGENIGITTKKNARSSHTPIKMRIPVYFETKKDKKSTVPIQLDLDRLPIRDIEFLRGKIKEHEGRVDTEIMFENPKTDEDKILDVTTVVAFFFPSEAI